MSLSPVDYPELKKQGYAYYCWVPPHPTNAVGYFAYFDDNMNLVKTKNVEKHEVGEEKEYGSVEELQKKRVFLFNVKSLSQTTLELGPNVPVGSIFGWCHNLDCWMYLSSNGKIYYRSYVPESSTQRIRGMGMGPMPVEGGRKLKKTRTLKNLRRK